MEQTPARRKLVLVLEDPLPTHQANGHQTVMMSRAFARCGLDVELWHLKAAKSNPRYVPGDVFDHHQVDAAFAVRALRTFDVRRFERLLPGGLFKYVLTVHDFLWGFSVARKARGAADLFHTRSPAVLYWFLKRGLPAIYESHDAPVRFRRRLLRRIAKSPHLVAANGVTEHIRDYLVGLGFPATKVFVMPNAMDLDAFTGRPARGDLRVRLGLPEESLIIGYVGSCFSPDRERGIHKLIEAVAYAGKELAEKPMLLYVGGPQDLVPSYLETVHRVGLDQQHVRFVDWVPRLEVPDWMRACDVLTIPWDPAPVSLLASPLKLFEYMASGVPIVASDLPAMRAALRHRENAVLVEPEGPEALAEGILSVLRDPELGEALAKTASEVAQTRTWESRAAEILALADLHPPSS